MKKKTRFPVKEVLFTYLAINKIMYWINTIMTMNQSDLDNVGRAVLMRFASQDLIIIIGVVIFFFLDQLIESKRSNSNDIWGYAIFYVVGYVLLLGIGFIHQFGMMLMFEAEPVSLGEFARIAINYLPAFTLYYLVVAVALEVKQYFKQKEKESSKV